MNDFLFTSLSNLRTSTRSDDVSVMFDYFRLNKEKLITDYTILIILNDFFPFRKRNHGKMIIFNKRVDPLGVYPT